MESQLIVKNTSSILFPVMAKRSSLTTNVFGCSKKPKSWNNQEKHSAVSLRFKSDGGNKARSIILHKTISVRANAVPEESAVVPKSPWESLKSFLDVFFKFARLTVLCGTGFSAISMSLLTVEKMSDISLKFLIGMIPVIIVAVCGNIYVSGLNHLCDVEVDKVNKPEHPLVSGEVSMKTGALIVLSAVVMGLSIPILVGSWPWFWAMFISSFFFGFAYSVDLPLLRWKRYPLMVAIFMLVNISVTNTSFFMYMQTHVLGRSVAFTKPLIFAVTMTTLMMIIYGVFKDISDVAGDKMDGVQSLPILFGEEKVFKVCVTLLEILYVAAMLVGTTLSNPWSKCLTVGGHVVVALILWNRIKSFDYSCSAAYKSFYIFLWKLYFTEYLLVQFVR